MKKLVLILLSVSALSLTACSSKDGNENNNAAVPAPLVQSNGVANNFDAGGACTFNEVVNMMRGGTDKLGWRASYLVSEGSTYHNVRYFGVGISANTYSNNSYNYYNNYSATKRLVIRFQYTSGNLSGAREYVAFYDFDANSCTERGMYAYECTYSYLLPSNLVQYCSM